MADVEMTAEVFWQLLGMVNRAAVERGEPDARTRQVLQVSAENDRLRREVADLTQERERLFGEMRKVYNTIWFGRLCLLPGKVLQDLLALLPDWYARDEEQAEDEP